MEGFDIFFEKLILGCGQSLPYGIDVREKGLLKGSLGKIKCAVCPECGYTETYIENTDKIKKLVGKYK